jgi:pantoate--beta-alanine ligase
MEVVRGIGTMKAITRQAKARGQRIGFVPTMGALHEGHLSLVRRARQKADLVVVSIFVNPTQFGPHEDYDRYPRDLEGDIARLAQEDVDYVFTPAVQEIYPPGYATYVEVEGLSERLCGRSRPGHFRGVATVVLKLIAIISPDYAFFGQKDAQQAVIIRKMVEDLNLDVEIIVCPIVREADGLAMSSRNRYLNAEERAAATILYKALQQAKQMIEAGTKSAEKVIQTMRAMIESQPHTRIDYVEIVEATTLEPLTTLTGECLIALAVFVGQARLIDNLVVQCE